MSDLIERLRCPNASAGDLCDLADEAADAIERLTAELAAARETARRLMEAELVLLAERDSARRDGMSAAASILEAEHEKRFHIDNHAAYYVRMIREAIGEGRS